MTAGKCMGCGNEFKNVETHMRFCKVLTNKPTETIQEPQECPKNEYNPVVDTNTPTIKERVVNVLNMGKRPIIINGPDKNYCDDGMDEATKIKNFLKDAPLWTKYKPTAMNKMMVENLNKGKSFAPCVFVSEHDAPKILYMPYEPEKNRLIIPDKGFYNPSQKSPPFFFHSDYSLELIHAPILKDRFNLPAHVRQADYAAGLREGVTQAADQLINEIKKYKNICYVLGFITIMLLFVVALVAYSYDSNFKAIATQTNNLTIAIRDMRP